MTTINPHIFREYDIRGIAEKDFDTPFAQELGRTVGALLLEKGETTIAIGLDCRLTSVAYFKALSQGFQDVGINVVSLGICPTPLVYFAIFHENLRNGISITGSHNPGEYNGFKLCLQKTSFYGEAIQKLKGLIEQKKYHLSSTPGTLTSLDIKKSYVSYLLNHIKIKRPLSVVVDAGNGVAGPVAPGLLRQLGCTVKELFCDMDGRFPNHHPDPTVPENLADLKKVVLESGADCGLAFDGDADRIGVIDNKGTILWGDELMILFSRHILKKYPGAPIIGEVKCSKRLYDDIALHGGRPIMWKTGHSLIKAKLAQEKAVLAGEMSGHLFFADRYYGFDDAIYAACRLLEIIAEQQSPLSELLKDVPEVFNTPEIRVDCDDQRKFEIVKKAQDLFRKKYKTNDIDGVRIEFEDGWALVRASNTQPVLVMRFEAQTKERLKEIRSLVENEINQL